jgi:hypothetical protein
MKKLLLVVLTSIVLVDASRAEDAPAGTTDAEPGMVTATVRQVRKVAYRLTGRVLASFIMKGMDHEQVRRILEMPPAWPMAPES